MSAADQPLLDGGTQWHPLSATVKQPAYRYVRASSCSITAAHDHNNIGVTADIARAAGSSLTTSKGTSWARARRATRDFLARPAGGPHDLSANGAPRRGTKSGARVAAAAQVLSMGHVRAISTSNARYIPSGGPSSRPCQLRVQ